MPRGMLEFWADPQSAYHKDVFAQSGKLILFCASGWRSALAAKTLPDMGMTNIFDMDGEFTGGNRTSNQKRLITQLSP